MSDAIVRYDRGAAAPLEPRARAQRATAPYGVPAHRAREIRAGERVGSCAPLASRPAWSGECSGNNICCRVGGMDARLQAPNPGQQQAGLRAGRVVCGRARRNRRPTHETRERDRANGQSPRAFQNSKLSWHSLLSRAHPPRAHTRDSRDLSVNHDTMRYLLLLTDTRGHSSFCAEPHFEAVMHAFSCTR